MNGNVSAVYRLSRETTLLPPDNQELQFLVALGACVWKNIVVSKIADTFWYSLWLFPWIFLSISSFRNELYTVNTFTSNNGIHIYKAQIINKYMNDFFQKCYAIFKSVTNEILILQLWNSEHLVLPYSQPLYLQLHAVTPSLFSLGNEQSCQFWKSITSEP